MFIHPDSTCANGVSNQNLPVLPSVKKIYHLKKDS